MNPAQFIQDGKRMSRLPSRVLSEEEVEKVLAVPDLSKTIGFRDRTIMEVIYSTGLRLNEAAHLKVEDIDLVERLVRVNLGKGGKYRVVPIGEKACGFVEKYLREVRPLFLRKREDEPQAVWLKKDGGALTSILIQANFRQYGRLAGIPERTNPHAFRHAFATHLLRDGADIQVVSRMLGHANTRVTQLYTHLAAVDVKKEHGQTHPREKGAETVPSYAGDADGGVPVVEARP